MSKAGIDRVLSAPPIKRSFPPVVDHRARILVLGTLPGEESLRRGEYYAHPRNLFWPIIFALFGETPPPAYSDRVRSIGAHKIALWDVCASARRVASADTTIAAEVPNAIDALLDTHPGIRAVAFNRRGACQPPHDLPRIGPERLDEVAEKTFLPAKLAQCLDPAWIDNRRRLAGKPWMRGDRRYTIAERQRSIGCGRRPWRVLRQSLPPRRRVGAERQSVQRIRQQLRV